MIGDCDKTHRLVRGRGRGKEQSYIEKRRLSFMYFIVDKMIILLSARFMIG